MSIERVEGLVGTVQIFRAINTEGPPGGFDVSRTSIEAVLSRLYSVVRVKCSIALRLIDLSRVVGLARLRLAPSRRPPFEKAPPARLHSPSFEVSSAVCLPSGGVCVRLSPPALAPSAAPWRWVVAVGVERPSASASAKWRKSATPAHHPHRAQSTCDTPSIRWRRDTGRSSSCGASARPQPPI